MEGDVADGAIFAELEVQWRHVRFEGQSWGGVVGAEVVEGGAVCELGSRDNVSIVGEFGGVPGGEAVWIAVIAALAGVGVVGEGAVEVHLFAGVVLVDVHAITGILIAAVLDGVDTACDGVLCDTHTVAETPAQAFPFCCKVVSSRRDS